MRISRSFCLISVLLPLALAAPVARPAETAPDLPEKPAYVEMLRGDHYRDLGQGAKARGCYEAALTIFEKLHLEQPAYKPASIEFRTDYCRKQIKALKDSGVIESAPAESPAETAAPTDADRALQEKNEALRREVESLKARLGAAPESALAADLEKAAAREVELKRQIDDFQTALDAARAETKEWKTQAEAARRDAQPSQRDMIVLGREKSRLEAQVESLKARVDSAETARKELKDQLDAQPRGEGDMQKLLDKAVADRDAALKDLEDARAAAREAASRASMTEKELKDQLASTTRLLGEASKGEAPMRKQNEELQSRILSLQKDIENLHARAAVNEADANTAIREFKDRATVAERDARTAAKAESSLRKQVERLQAELGRANGVMVAAPAAPAPAPAPETAATPAAPAPEAVPAPAPAAAPAAAPEAAPAAAAETLEHAAALVKEGDLQGAVRAYHALLDQNPVDAAALQNLAKLHLQMGETRSARRVAEQLSRAQPDSAAQQYAAGSILARVGDPKGAVRMLESAVQLEPENATYVRDLAVALYQLGRYDDAAGQYRTAVRLKPEDGQAHFNLAALLLLQKQPDVDEARRHYEKALSLGEARDPAIEKKLNP